MIIFKNGQWKVEKQGMTGDRDYFIEAKRLGDLRNDGLYSWPLHMVSKVWVDFEAFKEAFDAALAHFLPDHGKEALARTYERCARRIEESREYDLVKDEMYPGKHFWTAREMFAVHDEACKRLRLRRADAAPAA